MKTLLTGGTGFIGSHIVDALVAKARHVRCLVRRSSDIRHLKQLGVELVYGDVVDKDSLRDALLGIDIVYHLAAFTAYGHKPDEKYDLVNFYGTKNLLELCLEKKIHKFIYFSSIAAVGPTQQPILLNEGSPYKPVSPYGISKAKAEKLVLEYFNKYSLPSVVLRPSKVYGPRDMSELVKLYRLVERGYFYFIAGMRDRQRSFCYVDNLVKVSLIVENKESALGQIYFIADKRPYTIAEFVEAVAKEERVNLPKIDIPLWAAKLPLFCYIKLKSTTGSNQLFSLQVLNRLVTEYEICDISKAQRELNYIPTVDLNEGMRRTITRYKKQGLLH